MSAKGFNLAEEGKVISILPPVDINGGLSSDVFSMKGYAHASIIITLGVTGAATTITVEEADDFVPTNDTAIPFAVYKEETAAGDTLGSRVAATSSGFATSTNNGLIYLIEIDADELTDGYPALYLKFSDPAAATFASAVAALSGSRYKGDLTPTAIA